jgi:hypothetical protein
MSDQKDIDAAIAGQILSSWLPVGVVRRVVFSALGIWGLFGFFGGSSEWYHYAVFFAAALMSPRCVGWLAFIMGKISSK